MNFHEWPGYDFVHLMYCVGCGASWIGEDLDACSCTCVDGDVDYERWINFEVPWRERSAEVRVTQARAQQEGT